MSAPTTSDPAAVTTKDGVSWLRRAVTQDGRGLYAVDGSCQCPEYLLATLAELAENGIQGQADALPMPVGPQMPPFPPASGAFEEKLRSDVARLQGLLAEAVAEKHRACRERDLMRERVSEPYGCRHCGIAKRGHARQWKAGVGVHAWTAPSQEQIAERMKARRTVRLAAEIERLRARVAELEQGAALPWAHDMSDGDLRGFLDDLVSAALNRWRSEPDVPDRVTLVEIEKACAWWRTPGQGLRSDEAEGSSAEPAHPSPRRFPKSPGCTCRLTGAEADE